MYYVVTKKKIKVIEKIDDKKKMILINFIKEFCNIDKDATCITS
jgi:hypothetical protein